MSNQVLKLKVQIFLLDKYKAVMQPPHRGMAATMLGMTWARGFIFFGSDVGREMMKGMGFPSSWCIALPPALCEFLFVVNMPLVRATITTQNP